MTSVDVVRRLPRAHREAAAERLSRIEPQDWTLAAIRAELVHVLPAVPAGRVAAFVFLEAPVPRPARILADILGQYRTVQHLDPEPSGEPPGKALPDVAAVAAMLDVTMGELEWFADEGAWLRRAALPLRHYRIRRMAKPSGGVRVIEAPKPRLAEAQRRILRHVLDPVPTHPAACGFRPGGSVLAYASPHAWARTVVRFDLRDCFTTVTLPRVRKAFRRAGYPSSVARVLAAVCTTATPVDELRGLDGWQAAALRARHLPQGAPSSPALVNLSLRGLDARLAGLARSQGARYTRYGDDLAFSGAVDGDLLAGVVPKIVASEGLTANATKTRVMRAGSRHDLAGMVVNERAQVSRAEYDELRALVHNALRFGAESQNRDDRDDFRAYVYGRIAWVGQGNAHRRERLLAMAARVQW